MGSCRSIPYTGVVNCICGSRSIDKLIVIEIQRHQIAVIIDIDDRAVVRHDLCAAGHGADVSAGVVGISPVVEMREQVFLPVVGQRAVVQAQELADVDGGYGGADRLLRQLLGQHKVVALLRNVIRRITVDGGVFIITDTLLPKVDGDRGGGVPFKLRVERQTLGALGQGVGLGKVELVGPVLGGRALGRGIVLEPADELIARQGGEGLILVGEDRNHILGTENGSLIAGALIGCAGSLDEVDPDALDHLGPQRSVLAEGDGVAVLHNLVVVQPQPSAQLIAGVIGIIGGVVDAGGEGVGAGVNGLRRQRSLTQLVQIGQRVEVIDDGIDIDHGALLNGRRVGNIILLALQVFVQLVLHIADGMRAVDQLVGVFIGVVFLEGPTREHIVAGGRAGVGIDDDIGQIVHCGGIAVNHRTVGVGHIVLRDIDGIALDQIIAAVGVVLGVQEANLNAGIRRFFVHDRVDGEVPGMETQGFSAAAVGRDHLGGHKFQIALVVHVDNGRILELFENVRGELDLHLILRLQLLPVLVEGDVGGCKDVIGAALGSQRCQNGFIMDGADVHHGILRQSAFGCVDGNVHAVVGFIREALGGHGVLGNLLALAEHVQAHQDLGHLGAGGGASGAEAGVLEARDKAGGSAEANGFLCVGGDAVVVRVGTVRVGLELDPRNLDVLVEHGAEILTGDGAVGRKASVADALDDLHLGSPGRGAGVPLPCPGVTEGGDVVVGVGLRVGGQHGHEHGPGHVLRRGEGPVSDAGHPALLGHIVHRCLVPGFLRHIRKGRGLYRYEKHGEGHDNGKHQSGETSELVLHFAFPFLKICFFFVVSSAISECITIVLHTISH